MATKTIILIGGAPTTGKSTIAHMIAKHLDIPFISTDDIRSAMQAVARREDHPNLFNPEGYDGERFLTEFSAEEIADKEWAQGEATWIGIKKILQDYHSLKQGCVIEGVNILPYLVNRDFPKQNHIKAVFLVDDDKERIRNVVLTRGLWDQPQNYPDSLKEKEVDWVLSFSEKIKTDARKFGYHTIEVKKQDDDLGQVLKALEI